VIKCTKTLPLMNDAGRCAGHMKSKESSRGFQRDPPHVEKEKSSTIPFSGNFFKKGLVPGHAGLGT
jgi:hypothetical protein